MSVNIKIIGTQHDASLLKKAIKEYAERTTVRNEKENCECYIHLIEQAEKEAKERAKKEDKNNE